MTAKNKTQIEEMKNQTIWVEVEMNSITRPAAAKLAAEGQTGARTVLDVPPAYLSPLTGAELRRTLL